MRLRALAWPLSLTAVLVAVPLSFEWLVVKVGPVVLGVLWQSIEAIGLAQLAIVAFLAPVVLLAKAGERWPRVGQAIVLGGIVVLALIWISNGAPIPIGGCGGSGPRTLC